MVICGAGKFDQPMRVWNAIRDSFAVAEGHGRVKANFGAANNIDSKKPKPPDMLINVVVEFPGVMPLIAEIQIHYRPVLELKEAEHFMYEIRRACCVQELTGAPLVEPGAASRGGGKCANSRKSARKS